MPENDQPSLELPKFRLRRPQRAVEGGAPQRPQPVVEEIAQRPTRNLRLPGPLAAAVTGLLVGVAAVVLVWTSQALCESTTGTSSCGGGPGLLLVVLVVAVLATLGWAVLSLLGAAYAGSTSTLAVGIATVVTLLLFVDSLGGRSGAVLVVLTAVVAYVVAQALTNAATESAGSPSG